MPLKSMTGSGEASARSGIAAVRVHVRSVNGKGLRSQISLPDALSELSGLVEARIAKAFDRGTVDVRVQTAGLPDSEIRRIDRKTLSRYLAAWRAAAGADARPHPALFALPGVVRTERPPRPPAPIARRLLAAALEDALARLDGMRRREGARLERANVRSLRRISALVTQAQAEAPKAAAEAEQHLRKRMADILGPVADPALAAREAALVAQKGDVAEELERLESHIAQTATALRVAGPQGRRIDFLAQEILRESSTLGAKALSRTLADLAREIRLEAERIREQAQNVE
ncbi:MAG: DUF1732 domain-containing protein [Planctomycetota bacterium]